MYCRRISDPIVNVVAGTHDACGEKTALEDTEEDAAGDHLLPCLDEAPDDLIDFFRRIFRQFLRDRLIRSAKFYDAVSGHCGDGGGKLLSRVVCTTTQSQHLCVDGHSIGAKRHRNYF